MLFVFKFMPDIDLGQNQSDPTLIPKTILVNLAICVAFIINVAIIFWIPCMYVFEQYECLVEGCGVKLKSYKSRQQHLVDKHKFPASFEFFKKAAYHHPSKKQRQKYQKHKQAKEAAAAADGDQIQKRDDDDNKMEVEETMDGLVLAVSKLSTSSDFSPSSISFGRRHNRGFTFIPRSVHRERKQEASSPAVTKKA